MNNTTPKFTHDCDKCKFLGSGKYQGADADFYTCPTFEGRRTFIARYGDEGPEYSSCPLFCCVELTALDKVALYNGLELNEAEEKALLCCLAAMYKNKFTVNDYENMSAGVNFGGGNVMFENF